MFIFIKTLVGSLAEVKTHDFQPTSRALTAELTGAEAFLWLLSKKFKMHLLILKQRLPDWSALRRQDYL